MKTPGSASAKTLPRKQEPPKTCQKLSLFAETGGLDIDISQAGSETAYSLDARPHCIASMPRDTYGKAIWNADARNSVIPTPP